MDAELKKSSGRIFTFYSYKGGVGRTMALANVAAWLSAWGKKVLTIDWDLEAPGLHRYYQKWFAENIDLKGGVIDALYGIVNGDDVGNWKEFVVPVLLPHGTPVDFLASGAPSTEYFSKVQKINWPELFTHHDIGKKLEEIRNQWINEYDMILIDSRTGITDIGGICTILLPDVVVAFYTANQQSIDGTREILLRSRSAHSSLVVDRMRLLTVPVLSRDESESEFEMARHWRELAGEAFREFMQDWLPLEEKPNDALNLLKIPYVTYWSFGERLPVVEEDDRENPKTLAFGFQPLSRLIFSNFDWRETRLGQRVTEAVIERELQNESKKRLEYDKKIAFLREKSKEERQKLLDKLNSLKAKSKASFQYYRFIEAMSLSVSVLGVVFLPFLFNMHWVRYNYEVTILFLLINEPVVWVGILVPIGLIVSYILLRKTHLRKQGLYGNLRKIGAKLDAVHERFMLDLDLSHFGKITEKEGDELQAHLYRLQDIGVELEAIQSGALPDRSPV